MEVGPPVALDPFAFGDRPNQKVLDYVDRALPSVFRNYVGNPGAKDNFHDRFMLELKTHHRFSSLVVWSSFYSNAKPVYAVAFQLFSIASFISFALAVCFKLMVSFL
jgi:hypothetical protein